MQNFGGVSSYIASFDLTAIADKFTDGAIFRLTQECGNDAMVGQIVDGSLIIVPEPATNVGLMALLLGGAFFRSRRSSAR
jgi:hypothetical protein